MMSLVGLGCVETCVVVIRQSYLPPGICEKSG